ncbi:hypothetical protein IFM89_031985 [Coptis chinensis]|uniref:Response regulatory domain-containing protein n=1 Tax=Coptis chinensis TaxID=261450 RepID=A0A835HE82_9MAGN|nr:hypothetical protein IFM89_003509 [Coptis chinensis]KAF9598865.1 hypothetical protein IFM89_031985 [Coptis chinensis]
MASSSSTSNEFDCGEEPHVLAVDDNIIDRKLIEQILKKYNCKVTIAENGLRALEYLGIGDQKGTTENKESSTMKEIPVVIVSSENIPTRINKCIEEGAQEFMLKPIKPSDVKKLRCQMTSLNKPTNGRFCLGR